MSPNIGKTFAFLPVRGASRLNWALPSVREKAADWWLPNRSESEAKALPDAPIRTLARTGPAGALNSGPEAMNWRLPVSDLARPVSWARGTSRLAGIGPEGLTTI